MGWFDGNDPIAHNGTVLGGLREVTSVLPVMTLAYVRRALGDTAADAVSRRAGVDPDDPRLLSTDEWVPWSMAVAVADAAGEICGDRALGRRVGEEYFRYHQANGLSEFLLAEGGITEALIFAATFASRLSSGRQFSVGEGDDSRLVVSAVIDGTDDRFLCEFSTGYLAQIPSLFGSQGTAVETHCSFDGAPACRFELRWTDGAGDVDVTGRADIARRAATEAVARFEDLQAMSAELLGADSLSTVLERIVHRVSLAVMAPRALVTARSTDDAEPKTVAIGFDDATAAAEAESLWSDGAETTSGRAITSALATPHRHYGHLAVYLPEGAEQIEIDERFLRAYAANATAAIERVATHEHAQKSHATTRALLALAGNFAEASSVEEVCARLADAIPRVVGCDVGGVWLWHDHDRTFELVSWTESWADAGRMRLPARDLRTLTDLAERPRPIMVDTDDDDPVISALLESWGVREAYAVPIQLRGEFLGMVAASSTSPLRGADTGVAVLERLSALADHASTAIDSTRLLEQIRHQALHDPLTDLPNRVLAEERAREALAHADRHAQRVGLLFVDLDRFKNVNDTLGHSAGDQLIRLVGARLQQCLRGDDFVARLGGDEFFVLLPRLGAISEAVTVANTIIDAVRQPFQVGDQPIFISSSVGIACFPDHGHDYPTLMSHADLAMYDAKDYGRSTYAVHAEEHTSERHRRLELESQLHLAVENDELVVHYQPQVELATSRIVGVEALVRWNHPESGLIGPDAFLGIAEESGLIVEIDEVVRRHALAQARAWAEAGKVLRLALNLSTRDLRNPDIVDDLAVLIDGAGVDPALVELEITDRVVMSTEDLPEVMRGLRTLGTRLSIDDFGTGSSVISRLQHCPVDSLKIDRSFIADLSVTEPDTRIVNALISMAHALELSVVAEGIEHAEQAEILRQYGCEVGQGYLFGRAVPAEELDLSTLRT